MLEERTYDDRDGWIWLDGKLVPWREANVHILTHALHYASSVFEGQRLYNGTIFRLSDHSARLVSSAKILGFDLPWSVAQIDAACMEVVKANRSEEHTSELQSLMRISYAVFCLKKKRHKKTEHKHIQ